MINLDFSLASSAENQILKHKQNDKNKVYLKTFALIGLTYISSFSFFIFLFLLLIIASDDDRVTNPDDFLIFLLAALSSHNSFTYNEMFRS